jgi:toxin CcdB
MLTPQLAGIEKKQMGSEVASLAEHRNEIIAALDLLLTGI